MENPQPNEAGIDKSAATVLIEILAGLLLVLNILASSLAPLPPGDVEVARSSARFLGAVLGQIAITLLVYGLLRLFGQGKTRRGRALIVLVTLAIIFIGSVGKHVS